MPLRFDTDHTISENLFDLSLSSPQINPQGTLTPERRLGSGSYGVVNSVVDSKGNRFACKVLRTQETKDNANPYSDYTSILREIAILSTFQGHPNIVRCFSCNLNRRADTYEIVMELMDGDLSSICRNNDAEQRMHHFQSIAYQILSGVAYLHTEGFSHRDIKSSNILYRKRRDGSLEIKVSLGLSVCSL